MKQFSGFPARMRFTPIPDYFFSALLPYISDVNELKVTLHLLRLLHHQRGYPRLVTRGELRADKGLMLGLTTAETLDGALEMATRRGTFLHLVLETAGGPETVYLLNTGPDREALARIKSGELPVAGLEAGPPARPEAPGELPDIFSLYEQNIGMLTPLVAEELREAEKIYPESWIQDAIREAVKQNKRKWGYVAAILERWSTEGRSDGTHQRDSAPPAGPDKYFKGKYGHMVRG
ncbi:MAG: DnaD domain protein [Chloroflexota bacterium]